MTWDGMTERRKTQGAFCNQHIDTIKLLTEVSTSLKGLLQQMADNSSFKRNIIVALISIVVAMFIQIGTVSYIFGQQSRQITVNTARLDIIEQVAREVVKNNFNDYKLEKRDAKP